jgi:LacI family transcriptional regulator
MSPRASASADSHILVRLTKPLMAEGVRDYFKQHRWRKLLFLGPGTGLLRQGLLGRTIGEISTLSILQESGPVVSEGSPLVSLGEWNERVPWVVHDYRDRGRLAGEYLCDLNLKHLAYIGHPQLSMSCLMQRGIVDVAEERGVSCDCFGHSMFDALVPGSPEHEPLQQWLADLPKPVGLLCLFSFVAVLLSEFIQHLGWTIPNDIAVVGGNPGGLDATMNLPTLSYTEDNDWQMGYEAARLLELQLQGRSLIGMGVQVPSVRIHPGASTDLLAVEDARLERAVRFLRKNAFEKITVQDVARHARISRRNLEQMIRQELGVSVHEELTRVRINRAKELLASSNSSLTEIALECGLEWATSLGNLFRNRVGVSPGKYRETIRRTIRGESTEPD